MHLDAAIDYIKAGILIFPIHGTENGRCTCGRKNCSSPGKHPATKNGFKAATREAVQVTKWWSDHPSHNIGVPTGKVNGFFVLDIDVGKKGDETLDNLQRKYGRLPSTVTANTGGGGNHYFFKYPSEGIANSAGTIGSGVDIRGDGGYVVVAPSDHISGKKYSWQNERKLDLSLIVEAPEWLTSKRRNSPSLLPTTNLAESIPEGQRNTTLVSLAGVMRRRAMTEQEVLSTLVMVNDGRCNPPLDKLEVEKIAASVCQYEPQLDIPLTDLGNAERLALRHGDDLRYCHLWKSWMIWKGHRWERDVSGELDRRAKETVRSILHESVGFAEKEQRQKFGGWAKRSEDRARIRALIDLAGSELPIQPEQFDQAPMLLNTENGTVNLETYRLQPHRREDYLTKVANVEFDEAATYPIFAKFLNKIFAGDADLIDFVQRLAGYSLTGETGEQAFYVLFGTGANGKSTLVETLLGLLGDYGKKSESSMLLAKKQDSVRNDIAALRGVRLVVATEVERGRRLNEPLVKELTGGDTITARHLYQEFFEYAPQFKLMLATNYKPDVRGVDEGIWRRVVLIPFDVTISPEERDKDLPAKLSAERPGILNWALEGLKKYRDNGFPRPKAVRQASESYREEMDYLGDFIDAKLNHIEGGFLSAAELWNAYEKWCVENGENGITQRILGKMMTDRGYERTTKREGQKTARGYVGVRLQEKSM